MTIDTRALPSIRTGSNNATVHVGDNVLEFSYATLIAYRTPATGRVVSENVWGPTTGKHLNAIDGGAKAARLPRDEFEARALADLA